MRRSARFLALLGLASAANAFAQLCPAPQFDAPVTLWAADSGAAPAPSGRIASGDFDGGGTADVALLTPDALVFIPGSGGPYGVPRQIGTGGLLVRAGDMNGDGHPDLLVLTSAEMHVVFVAGDGTTTTGSPTALPSEPRGATLGDFDGDGKADAVVLTSGGAYLYPGNGSGSFGVPRAITLPPEAAAADVASGDFDGDGNVDLWFPSATASAFGAVLTGNGHGVFTPALEPAGVDGGIPLVADLDGNGVADRALAGTLSGAGKLFVRFSGGVTASQAVPAPFAGAALGDFDGDGHPDVAVAGSDRVAFVVFHAQTPAESELLVDAVAVGAVATRGVPPSDLLVQRKGGRLDFLPSSCGSRDPDVVLPSLVSLSGIGGTRFESQLTLANRGGSALSMDVTYTAAQGGGTGFGRATIGAGQQQTFPSAFEFLRSIGIPVPTDAPLLGAVGLDVTAGLPTDLAALVRTTAAAPAAPGKGGVAYGGIPLSHAIAANAWIPWLREDARDRTNVALVHAGGGQDGSLILQLTVISGDPAHKGAVTLPEIVLQPGNFKQINGVLGASGLGATSGYLRIQRIDGTAPFVAYGIVNDQLTGDGSYVPAVPDEERQVTRGPLVFPAVVEVARYRSELVIVNLVDHDRVLTGQMRLGEKTVVFTLGLPSNSQLDIPDFVQYLRGLVTSLPPAGTDVTGALFLNVDDGDVTTLLAGVRTSSADAAGYGVFMPAVPMSAIARSSAWLFGLRQDAEVRTNLAIVNAGDETSRYTIRWMGGAPAMDVTLEPRSWLQIGKILTALGVTAREGYVRVDTSSAPFVTYAVVNDGAEPGQGTGDGSYVPMQTW